MNVFGAFTFGSLIKTFVPGFVWIIALGLLWWDAHALLPAIVPAIALPAAGEEQTVLVLAVPVSILLGLLSNIVVFMGVNDVLVRNRAPRMAPVLFDLRKQLLARVRAQVWRSARLEDGAAHAFFMERADGELLVLETLDLNKLMYVREQYWYHLEFQVNILLSTGCGWVGLVLSPVVIGAGPAWVGLTRAVLVTVVLAGLCVLLWRSALRNYIRHIEKMCTLMAMALSSAAGAAEAGETGVGGAV
jgi:hypothetical protein